MSAARAGGVYLLGAGTVGQALGRSLRAAGVRVVGLWGRRRAAAARAARFVGTAAAWGEPPEAMRGAAVVIVAVSDRAIAEVAARAGAARRWRAGQVVLHCSGGLPAAVLRPAVPRGAAVGSMHPLQTFPSAAVGARLVRGSAFALEGDERARRAAAALVRRLGGWSFTVAPRSKALYHAAAATASNHLVALAADAAALAVAAGLPRARALRALLPLMHGVLRALEEQGLPGALTGPVARGDAAVVRAHLEAIARAAPERLELYRAAARRALQLARARGGAAPEALGAIARLLGKEGRR